MKEEDEIRRFVYRSYQKSELAQLYVPGRAKSTAVKTFNKWLRYHPPFWKKLQREGINIQTQVFNAAQVKLIVGYLGEP